jgi:HSP20 family molecular chaperone IbpA
LEDWRQAEAELVSPLCCGQTTVDGNLWIGADAAAFQEGTIEVWIAPRKITLCGKPCRDKMVAHRQDIGTHPEKAMIFHVLDLPVEIDPSGATVKFSGPSLELLLRKAQAKSQRQAQSAAA